MPSREPGFLVGVSDVATTPCTAVLAGATGLVGRELLSLLLAGVHYRCVHVLLRRAPPDSRCALR